MALQPIQGLGAILPNAFHLVGSPSFSMLGPIDATGEKLAYCGHVWFPARTGTKAIRRVCFRFGSVTKSGGSGLTLSLQDVALAAGPPMQPDETQDQTVAIANADATFAANTWHRSGVLSADRTVTFGDLLAVVLEYDGSGRSAPDTVSLAVLNQTPSSQHGAICVLKTASWAVQTFIPNIILEMSDGTFGTLEDSFPTSAVNNHTFHLDDGTSDEYAMPFSLPAPVGVDAFSVVVAPTGAGSDFEMLLYQGTTALVTKTIDANATRGTGQSRELIVPFAEVQLAAGTTYYIAVRPTSTNTVTVHSFDVDDANHLTCHGGGTSWAYTTRLNQGAWAAATATRRLFAGLRVSSLDDGAGGAGGGLLRPVSQSGGLV